MLAAVGLGQLKLELSTLPSPSSLSSQACTAGHWLSSPSQSLSVGEHVACCNSFYLHFDLTLPSFCGQVLLPVFQNRDCSVHLDATRQQPVLVAFALLSVHSELARDGDLPADLCACHDCPTMQCGHFLYRSFRPAITISLQGLRLQLSCYLVLAVDWEPARPRNDGNKQASPTVSVWRSILVANEWAEMQTMRKTNVKATLFLLAFLMVQKNKVLTLD